MKKFLSLVIVFLLSITTFLSPISSFADSKDVSISSPNSVVLDYETGKVLYEMDGVDEALAREAFRLAAAKLPLQTVFVTRQIGQ